jgi:hypothetical protein
MIWLGSEIGLEQVSNGLKWLGGNGKNGRTHATLGRYFIMDRIDELNTGVGKLNLLTYTKIVCTLGVW